MLSVALKTAFTNLGFALATASFIEPFFHALFILKVTISDQKSWPANKKCTMASCCLIKKLCSLHLIHCLLCLPRAFRACNYCGRYIVIWWPFSNNAPVSSERGIPVAISFFSLWSDIILYLSGHCWCFVLLSIGSTATEVGPQLLELRFLCLNFSTGCTALVESCCWGVLICARSLCRLLFNLYYNVFVYVLFLEQSIFVDNFPRCVSFSIDFAACTTLNWD